MALLLLCCTGIAVPLALGATTPAAPSGAAGAATKTTTPEGANGNAFSELSKSGEEETQTQKTETGSTTSTSSNSKKTILIIVAAALVLLSAIAYVIVRDARGVAPASDPQVAEERSARDTAAMMRKRRAKAKAARQARKRNR